MLEGTDEAPRRRLVSKDFPILFAVGMLAAFLSVLFQLKQKRIQDIYKEMEVGWMPTFAQFVFDLYQPLNLAIFIFAYSSILALFWYSKSIKSIWVLSFWMMLASPLAVTSVYLPSIHIMERIGKDSPPPKPIELLFGVLVSVEGFLTYLLIWCIFRAMLDLIVTKVWK